MRALKAQPGAVPLQRWGSNLATEGLKVCVCPWRIAAEMAELPR